MYTKQAKSNYGDTKSDILCPHDSTHTQTTKCTTTAAKRK